MQLAQLNIAENIYPKDDARMAPFTSNLASIQALAERSEGFVWRDLTDGEDADFSDLKERDTSDSILANLTVWENLETLFAFTYKTAHAKVMKANRDNFNDMTQSHYVLWWVKDGHQPSGREAKQKLLHLRKNGPSPQAFTFRMPFSETGTPVKPNFPKKDCA